MSAQKLGEAQKVADMMPKVTDLKAGRSDAHDAPEIYRNLEKVKDQDVKAVLEVLLKIVLGRQ